ncbi:MAG: antibiotic biosynthesis monooxygenase [Galbibacter orientalis]|uniref:putative quinol monooxygenase n=1 Tax=Galbibacter orientalis TaxID=453852 RepID=UPI00300201EE
MKSMFILASSCFIMPLFLLINSGDNNTDILTQEKDMMIRIAAIEVYPEHIESYKEILNEEATASVKIEPGVIAIFPMYEEQNPTQIRILEIYANKEAYEAHLQTPHFIKYKTSTQKMVKSLKLIDMDAIDSTTMQVIFNKLK